MESKVETSQYLRDDERLALLDTAMKIAKAALAHEHAFGRELDLPFDVDCRVMPLEKENAYEVRGQISYRNPGTHANGVAWFQCTGLRPDWRSPISGSYARIELRKRDGDPQFCVVGTAELSEEQGPFPVYIVKT